MKLIQVRKPLFWRSWQNSYVTVYPFLFYPDSPAQGNTLAHEEIHGTQQVWGLLIPWFLAYLILLPIGFNPLRYLSEWYAYRFGSGYDSETIQGKLAGPLYGWMPYGLNGWMVPKSWKE